MPAIAGAEGHANTLVEDGNRSSSVSKSQASSSSTTSTALSEIDTHGMSVMTVLDSVPHGLNTSIAAVTPTIETMDSNPFSSHHGTSLSTAQLMAMNQAQDHDVLAAANRDMFSWLLLNSENIAAGPNPGAYTLAAKTGMHHVGPHPPGNLNAYAAATATATAMGDEDPFRLIPADHAPLPITLGETPNPSTLAHSASSSMATPLHIDVLTTGASSHLLGTTSSSQSSIPALPPSNGIVTPTVASTPHGADAEESPMNYATKASSVLSRRGKKRRAPDGPGTPTSETTGPKNGKKGKENRVLSTTQQDLLRHLEHANDMLNQKQKQGRARSNHSIKAESASGSRSTDSSAGDSPSSLIRKQKLERNRESARECRRRKREHIQGVEERCRQLELENMELRGQLKAGKEAMKQEEREKNRVCEELEQMIQRGASEKELAEKIDNFKEQYSDYGHGRRSALRYHMHQIERLLLPTQVTKMCIWALRQDDSFWQDEEDETSLPVILAKELGLTEEQKKKIQQQRGSISAICENLKSALGLLGELKSHVEHKNVTLDNEMDKLQNILTPTQRAKFIVWVTNNQACMHLLNKLWRSVL